MLLLNQKKKKTLIVDEDIADRRQQYTEELYNDSEELEVLETDEEICSKKWVQL